MEISEYSLDSENEIIELLNQELIQLYRSDGLISDHDSDRFALLALLYKNFYNKIAKFELIAKLKIDENQAKNIHRKAWELLDFHNYNPARMDLIPLYIKHLTDIAAEFIQYHSQNNSLENLMLALPQNGDIENIQKERWAFIWNYISLMEETTKKIFMYKIYGGLSFDLISQLLNMDINRVIQTYTKAEAILFGSSNFKKYFNIR